MGQHRTALPAPPRVRQSPRPRRAVALGALLATGTAALTLVLGRQTLHAWPGTDITSPEGALLALALIASTALAGWLSVVLAVVVGDLARGCRGGVPESRSTSRTVRWTSAALLTITATPSPAALAGPPEPSWTSVSAEADAATGSSAAPEPGPPPEPHLLPDGSPVPLPGWTPTPTPPPVTPPSTVGLVSVVPREVPPDHVVVRAGDTLWSIAARRLGPSATVQDVAEEWPRWYAVNRAVIGPDPDLILPGQELSIPGPVRASSPVAAQGEGAGR